MKNRYVRTLVSALPILIFSLAASSCSGSSSAKEIVIGTMSEPGEPVLEHIKPAFEKLGYTLTVKLFTDFTTPDFALSDGSIDANLFQHEPYLNTFNSANKTDLFCAGKLYDCVYGGYTKKGYASLDQLPSGSKITVASDSSNLRRCLNILQSSGLIGLAALPDTLSPNDVSSYISANPKDFVIDPMSTDLIAASLDDSDVSLGLVNATFAINAGLTDDELLCQEQDPDHTNANIVACRSGDKDTQWIKDLISTLETDDVSQFITDTFKGVVTPYFLDFVNAKQ